MLPMDSPERQGETGRPPKARTHTETARIGRQCDKHVERGLPASKHPKRKSGINRWCPLTALPLFDVIRDVLPDMMHIVKGVFAGHFIPLFMGKRAAAPRSPKRPTKKPVQGGRESPARYGKRLKEYKAKVSTQHELMRMHTCRHVSYMCAHAR